MVKETSKEMFRKYITPEDLFRFKWRILRYMCEKSDKYDTFPETDLFHRTDFRGYIDSKLSKEYLTGQRGTLYKLIMNAVMDCLKDRDAIEIDTEYEYGDSEMVIYRKKKRLEDLCQEFKKYEMGDSALLDRLLPKASST